LGEIEGEICTDYLWVTGLDETFKVKTPFIARNVTPYEIAPYFDGMIGLAPKDESSGPLIVDHLFKEEKIKENVFSILQSKKYEDKAKLTFGSYLTEDPSGKFFDSDINSFVVHRIAGSFKWELNIIKVAIGGK